MQKIRFARIVPVKSGRLPGRSFRTAKDAKDAKSAKERWGRGGEEAFFVWDTEDRAAFHTVRV